MRHIIRATVVVALFSVLILFTGLLFAQQIPKQPIEKFVLSNGMQVLLREDHRTPNVLVDVVFHAGSGSEKPGETGYAHLFEHMMFQGTENLPGPFIEYSRSFGGSSGGWTSKDFTCFSDNIPSNYLERMLWMESDRLANIDNSIKQERLDVQRDVVKNERRQSLDNTPYSKVNETLVQTAYPPDHPYSWETVGRMEDLEHVTLASLKNFFRRYYSPDNATLVLYGDFVSADAKAMIQKYFANIAPGPGVTRLNQWIPTLNSTKRVTIEDNVSMPQIDYLWPTTPLFSEDSPSATMLSKILTGDPSSRLTNVLVEKNSLVGFVISYGSRDELSGEYHIELGLHHMKDAPRVEYLIDSVLAEIAAHGVTDNELEAAKTSYVNFFLNQLQSDYGLAISMFEYNFLLGDPDKFQWELDRYLHVTKEDVRSFAARYIDKRPRVIVTTVPRGDLMADTVSVDRKTMPQPGPESVFTPPAIQRATLANGLQLLLVENHHLPLVSAELFIRNGWSQDPADRRGLSTMTQALIDEETATKSKIQLAAEMQKAGANVYTGEYSDGTTLSVNVTKTEFGRSLATMADIVLHTTFSQVELEKKKLKFLSFLGNQRFDPDNLARMALYRCYYGEKSAYAQIEPGFGSEAGIKSVTRDELLDFYRTHYAPNASAILLAGDLSLEEAKAMVEKELGGWKAGPQSEYLPAPTVNLTGTKVVLVDQPEATQSVLYIGAQGLPNKHPDYYRYTAAMSVLCGMGPNDRINQVVREEKGFSYGIRGNYTDDRYQSLFKISGNVQTEHTAESVFEVVKAIKELRSQKPATANEVETVAKAMKNGFPGMFSRNQDMLDMLNEQWRKELSPNSWNEYLAEAKLLDSISVNAAAAKYIRPDQLIIVVVGDRSKIEEPLRALKLGEFVMMKPEELQ